MRTTISINEIFRIVNVEHGEPHQVLGMHVMERENGNFVVVRAFIPQASSILVIDAADTDKKYSMIKIHEDGFFELILEQRSKWFRYLLEITDYTSNTWTTYDPYEFPPTISEYDRYLFGAGNHYKIFEKLGAHIQNVNGVDGVAFGVWAPNAKAVSLIGDFNNWDSRRNPMRELGASGIWELFVPGMVEGDIYKYQVKDQSNHLEDKADPYASFAQVRPDTASVVFDSSKYVWQDSAYIAKRDKTNVYQQPMNIYEVHLGSWMRIPEEGNRPLTYLEAAEKLAAYVLEMGYTHIELLPVEEHPFDGSWGYQVTGYYAPTSRFGTPLDFKNFIDVLHQNNIGVILDWVPAHFPKDAFGLAKFDGTALYEHNDPKQGEHPDWGTLIFNYGRNEVRNFLIANAIYWIEEFHLDGLRVDAVASMLYLDYGKTDGQWVPNEYGGRENRAAEEFLKHMNSVICGRYPSVMMIAEESTAWAGVTKGAKDGGLGFSLKWNMGWMNDFLSYMKKDPIYRKYHQNDLTFSMVYAYTENFVLVLSHDEVVHGKGSMIEKMPGDMWQKFANLRAAYGFMYGHPGKKLLFMGSEFGQYAEWSESKSLDWHLLENVNNQELHDYMKELNLFYKQEPALWEMDFDPMGFEWIGCDDYNNSVVSFLRRGRDHKQELIFICNFTPQTHFDYRVGVPVSGTYVEVFNSDEEKFGGSGVINRKPLQSARILVNGRQNSVSLKVPPLGISVLKRTEQGSAH